VEDVWTIGGAEVDPETVEAVDADVDVGAEEPVEDALDTTA